jgi:hypothetical protein
MRDSRPFSAFPRILCVWRWSLLLPDFPYQPGDSGNRSDQCNQTDDPQKPDAGVVARHKRSGQPWQVEQRGYRDDETRSDDCEDTPDNELPDELHHEIHEVSA